MGNKAFIKRVKGITKYYAANHMWKYKIGDFLFLEKEDNNPYDVNAIAIYDEHNHKIGHIEKESNEKIYKILRDSCYICIIKSIFISPVKPSIEFEIIYGTSSNDTYLSSDLFIKYMEEYCKIRENTITIFEPGTYKEMYQLKVLKNIKDYPNIDEIIKQLRAGENISILKVFSKVLDIPLLKFKNYHCVYTSLFQRTYEKFKLYDIISYDEGEYFSYYFVYKIQNSLVLVYTATIL